MATTAPKKQQGIDIRHKRACSLKNGGGDCDCSPSYQAHVWDAARGKLIRKTFATVTEAKLWRRDLQVAMSRGERISKPETEHRVGAALDELILGMKDGSILDRKGRQYRPATIRDYQRDCERYLKPALGHLRLSEVRRRHLHKLIDEMVAAGLTGSSVRNKLDPLRTLYRRAVQDDEVPENPTRELRLPALTPRARQIAAPDRVEQLLDMLPDGERAAWATAFYGGLRVGELRALRWRNVDFDAGLIRVEAGWDDQEGEQGTKTSAGCRTVPLAGRLRSELVRHKLATGRGEADLCFGRSASEAFSRSTFRKRARRAWGWREVPNPTRGARPRLVWVKAHENALEPLSPHEARHTCASYFAAAGLTPKEAQEAMGHADIRTTLNIYAHAVPGWEGAAASKLDAYLDGVSSVDSRWVDEQTSGRTEGRPAN